MHRTYAWFIFLELATFSRYIVSCNWSVLVQDLEAAFSDQYKSIFLKYFFFLILNVKTITK